MPGTRVKLKLRQGPGQNLFPAQSGIYRVRIEVRTKTTQKKGAKQKHKEILLILKDQINMLNIED